MLRANMLAAQYRLGDVYPCVVAVMMGDDGGKVEESAAVEALVDRISGLKVAKRRDFLTAPTSARSSQAFVIEYYEDCLAMKFKVGDAIIGGLSRR